MRISFLLTVLLLPLPLLASPFVFTLLKESQHLSYRAIAIQNTSQSPQQLQQINFSLPPENIQLCTAGSSCLPQYQNTCTTQQILAPGAQCLVWFHAQANAKFAVSEVKPLTITITDAQHESEIQTIRMTARSELFAAGDFTAPANHIARWDGQRWSPVGRGIEGESVETLVEYKGDVVAGGEFYEADGKWINFIARWNGQDWDALRDGIAHPGPATLTVYADSLFAAGGFDQVDGHIEAQYLASFYDERWAGYQTGFNDMILALAVANNTLYLGGHFVEPVQHIARWEHNHMAPLGAGLNDVVLALAAATDGTLYAGGWFTHSGDISLEHIAHWNNHEWLPLGAGFDKKVQALSVNGEKIYAGGAFTRSGTQPLSAIAEWNGRAWQALAGGVTWQPNPNFTGVYSIASLNDDVFVGGYFTQANNVNGVVAAKNIARWQPSTLTWHALGDGLNGVVHSVLLVPILELSLV